MAKFGKTIRIYLADGVATGIRHAELVNWTGQAFVCPRARIGELTSWQESQRPGVYVLFGDDPAGSKPLAYIGEAENVFDRLRSHAKNKEFWEEVVFFTSKDENLTKVHVKYLESRIVELAKSVGRFSLENGTSPVQPSLPRADRDAMEEFLGPVRLLLTTLGRPLLQPLRKVQPDAAVKTEPDSDLVGPLADVPLSLTTKTGANAKGFATDEGFVVLGGSHGLGNVQPYLSEGYRTLREELIAQGDILEGAGGIQFARDVLFQSPSAAAAVLVGGNRNGRQAWRDAQGRSLGDLEEQLLAITSTNGSDHP